MMSPYSMSDGGLDKSSFGTPTHPSMQHMHDSGVNYAEKALQYHMSQQSGHDHGFDVLSSKSPYNMAMMMQQRPQEMSSMMSDHALASMMGHPLDASSAQLVAMQPSSQQVYADLKDHVRSSPFFASMFKLLREFHEHELRRIPGLTVSLVNLCRKGPQVENYALSFDKFTHLDETMQATIDEVKTQYESEQLKLNSVCSDICNYLRNLLQLQSELRPITNEEVQVHYHAIHAKFNVVRSLLKSRYEEYLKGLDDSLVKKRKRGNLPADSARLLRSWLQTHWANPVREGGGGLTGRVPDGGGEEIPRGQDGADADSNFQLVH
jgi:hypothetical protein